MSIRLAMELPTSKLKEWSPLADLDFILAHQVLEDEEYAEFFCNRPLNRELILDNSLHELGHPLAIDDLLEAAHRSRADYVISPDRVGDVEFNTRAFQECFPVLAGSRYKVAVVMHGAPYSTPLQRDDFLLRVREAHMLCCTFKEPARYAWYKESRFASRWHRVHLLGVDSFEELDLWATRARLDVRDWSVDTGKAFKWAMQGQFLDLIPSMRKASLHSKDLLNVKSKDISIEQEKLFRHNVNVLRKHLV